MTSRCFTIPGEPVGKGRHRTERCGRRCPACGLGTKLNHRTPDKTERYERLVADHARLAFLGRPKLTEALQIHILAVKARPKKRPPQVPKDVWSTGKLCWAPVKPDADNVLKAIKDGCSKASIWADDNLVVFAPPLTCYAETGGRPRVEVRITPAGHLDPSDVWEMLATLTPEFAAEQAAMSEGLRRFNAQVESDVARQLGGAP